MFETSRRPLAHSVSSLGKLRMQGAWKIELLHSSPRHRLYWITRGQGRISVNCITRGYGPNTAVYVPARRAHGAGAAVADPGARALPAARRQSRPSRGTVSPAHRQYRGAGQSDQSPREDRARACRTGACDGNARWRPIRCWSRSGWRESLPGRRVQFSASAAIAWWSCSRSGWRRSSAPGAGIADYAGQLQVTPTHLSRVCRDAAGRPAHALLTERIMYEARRLLLETDMPAREIAEASGLFLGRLFHPRLRTGDGPDAVRFPHPRTTRVIASRNPT